MSNATVTTAIKNNGSPQPQVHPFITLLTNHKGEIARALPKHMNADRLARIALTEFRKNPKLAECDPKSVFAAIIIASQLGLEPGLLGQAYLIPYKAECQLIPGYQGLIDLVRRTGQVKRIEAHVVREGDKFTYKTGLTTVLEHEPVMDKEPGDLILAYAVAEFTDGGFHVEVMSKFQIETIRNRSQGYKSAVQYNKDHPWITDTEEMWRKTLIRRICKYLPKSPELMVAVGLDDAAQNGERQGLTIDDAVAANWNGPVIDAEKEEKPLEKTEDIPTVKENLTVETNRNPEKKRTELSKKLMDAVKLYPKADHEKMYGHFFTYFQCQTMQGLKEEDFEPASGYIDQLVKDASKGR